MVLDLCTPISLQTENTGSGEKAGFQKSTAPQIQDKICKESLARKKLSFYKDKHKSPVKLSPKLNQTTLNLESFSPTKLCTAKLSSERSSENYKLEALHAMGSNTASICIHLTAKYCDSICFSEIMPSNLATQFLRSH